MSKAASFSWSMGKASRYRSPPALSAGCGRVCRETGLGRRQYRDPHRPDVVPGGPVPGHHRLGVGRCPRAAAVGPPGYPQAPEPRPALHPDRRTRPPDGSHPNPRLPPSAGRADHRPLERGTAWGNRRLDLDCLDQYLDGTPRLRIPPGKTATERLIPLHPEAAQAIRELQALALPSRGLCDDCSGRESARLFVRRGRRLSAFYLFEAALQTACERAGLVDHACRATITAHRFRHTVGTELVEGGVRLRTVMKMLGHTSPGMTLVYAHLSDATLREEYLKVLGPGAPIAGPLAVALRAGAMPPDSIAWLKANSFRTELELGHCLRLPEEGPCACDLYLTCAKFVTTPEYVLRLRERREREIILAGEVREHGFARDVERHECTRRRIEQLLVELGEAIDSSL